MKLKKFLCSRFFPHRPDTVDGYTFERPYPQKFPFPTFMMYHIALNSKSPKVWKKLQKTCKFFHSKNPIAVIKENFDNESYSPSFWYFISDKKRKGRFIRSKAFTFDELPCRLWLTGYLVIGDGMNAFEELTSPKIYQSDINELWLSKQITSFENFKCITATKNLKSVYLIDNRIYYNGTDEIVMLEEIMESLLHVKYFYFRHFNDDVLLPISIHSSKKLVELFPSSNLRTFYLCPLKEDFDFQTIFDYMLKQDKICFNLNFGSGLDENYTAQLTTAISEILKTENLIWPFHFIAPNLVGQFRYDNALWETMTFSKRLQLISKHYKQMLFSKDR